MWAYLQILANSVIYFMRYLVHNVYCISSRPWKDTDLNCDLGSCDQCHQDLFPSRDFHHWATLKIWTNSIQPFLKYVANKAYYFLCMWWKNVWPWTKVKVTKIKSCQETLPSKHHWKSEQNLSNHSWDNFHTRSDTDMVQSKNNVSPPMGKT